MLAAARSKEIHLLCREEILYAYPIIEQQMKILSLPRIQGTLFVVIFVSQTWTSTHAGFLFFKKAEIKKPNQLIYQEPAFTINQSVYQTLSPQNISIVVNLSTQRVTVTNLNNQLAIDAPISSGKAGHRTPSGTFPILQKDYDHRSNIYGNFVDSSGRIVRAGVSAISDSAPSGTHFEGAPMLYFCRLTNGGVGMHVGILPGYAASHGCIRMPHDVAQAIYNKVLVGTIVRVVN